MKKVLFIGLTILVTNLTSAQWNGPTNTTGTIDRTGNVVIGAQTPVSLLTVQQSSNDSSGGLTISDVGGVRQINIYGEGSNGRQVIKTNTANPLAFDLFGAERMRITSSGDVVIGTQTPVSLLTVQQSVNSSSGGLTISDVGGYRQINIYGEGAGGRQVIKTNTANPFVFDLNGAERMRILSNGNVGIGSTNPDELLTVKGTIHCEEVLVDLAVPADYVFERYYNGFSDLKSDYVMPTLEEVEAFTKANNHLPDVPSAKEIQENGLQLKEMTNILLQKIEELTLYTIEQEKRIKALEAKLTEKE